MAEQLNILQLNNGIPAASPVNGVFYIVINNVDNFITWETMVALLLAKSKVRAGIVNLSEGTNMITFKVNGSDTPFESTDYSFIPYSTAGIQEVSRDETGVVITALEAGALNYLAIMNT
jgi:hypothetical protein